MSNMKQLLFISISVLAAFLANAQNITLTQTVRGVVVDEQSGNTMVAVTVMVDVTPTVESSSDDDENE